MWRSRDIGLAVFLLQVLTGIGAAQPGAKEPAKFSIPVWHPDARWVPENIFAGSISRGFLEGPRLESQPYAGSVGLLYGPTRGGRNLFLSYDPETEFVHVVAGSAQGYLDGPFSRARFGVSSYTSRPRLVLSPDRHYSYLMDVSNRHSLRRFDFKKQEVTTLLRDINDFGGMTVDSNGKLLLIRGAKLLWLDPEGKQQKSLPLKVEETIRGIGGAGAPLALDEVHDRLYATAIGTQNWYIWYWDLKDGSFHGVLPVPLKGAGRKMDEAGPFEGTRLYNEGSVFFGPDDPQKRFLYTSRVDTYGLFRLDLEKKVIAALRSVPAAKGTPPTAFFDNQGVASRMPVYAGGRFTEDGSIMSSGHTPFVATRMRRIK